MKIALADLSVDVNAASRGGTTPLMKALQSKKMQYSSDGHENDAHALEILDILLVRCHSKHLRLRSSQISLLLPAQDAPGIDVNAARTDGRTALMVAASELLPSCVERLLAHGANRNAKCHKTKPNGDVVQYTAREFVQKRIAGKGGAKLTGATSTIECFSHCATISFSFHCRF